MFGVKGRTLTSIFSEAAGGTAVKFHTQVVLKIPYVALVATGHSSKTVRGRDGQNRHVFRNFLKIGKINFFLNAPKVDFECL
jgi:hypothetical protein